MSVSANTSVLMAMTAVSITNQNILRSMRRGSLPAGSPDSDHGIPDMLVRTESCLYKVVWEMYGYTNVAPVIYKQVTTTKKRFFSKKTEEVVDWELVLKARVENAIPPRFDDPERMTQGAIKAVKNYEKSILKWKEISDKELQA